MFAALIVHEEALGDSRVAYLGELASYAGGAHEALGRLLRLWSRCKYLQTSEPGVLEIRSCLGRDGETHLVASGLGETLAAGGVRVLILATDAARAAGGRTRAATAPRDPQGRLVGEGDRASSSPAGLDRELLSQISSPDSQSSIPELPDPDPEVIVEAERDPAALAKDLAPLGSIPARDKADRRRKLIGDAWAYAAYKHQELKAEGLDPHARNCWGAFPTGRPAELLIERVDELLIGERPKYDEAAEVLRNRVDVAVEEARKAKHMDWFIPRRMWDADSFSKGSALSPAAVRRSALAVVRTPGGPQKPDPEPPRKIRTLT